MQRGGGQNSHIAEGPGGAKLKGDQIYSVKANNCEGVDQNLGLAAGAKLRETKFLTGKR
jgi:hypothetical protein